jgi:predicted Zn-dependent protease
MTGGKLVALVVLMAICIVAVFLVIGRSTTGTAAASAASQGVVKGQQYEDAALGYSFEYPALWVKADQPKFGADASFLGPRRADLTMGLDVRSESNPTALDVYVDRSIKKVLPEFTTNFKVLEEKPLTVNGIQAIQVVYSYRQGQFDLTSVEAVYALGDRKVILTFCVLSEYYDELKAAVDASVQSFQRLGAQKA